MTLNQFLSILDRPYAAPAAASEQHPQVEPAVLDALRKSLAAGQTQPQQPAQQAGASPKGGVKGNGQGNGNGNKARSKVDLLAQHWRESHRAIATVRATGRAVWLNLLVFAACAACPFIAAWLHEFRSEGDLAAVSYFDDSRTEQASRPL